MRPSFRFTSALVAFAALCAALSLGTLTWQDHRQTREDAEQLASGRVDAGRAALEHYGCGGCHVIDGIDGARGRVGPPLSGIAQRMQIAGKLSNGPANLVRWIREPQTIDPGNGMPNLGVTETAAHDIAAYLYTLK